MEDGLVSCPRFLWQDLRVSCPWVLLWMRRPTGGGTTLSFLSRKDRGERRLGIAVSAVASVGAGRVPLARSAPDPCQGRDRCRVPPFISPFLQSLCLACARIVNSSGDPPALGCALRGWDARISSVAPPTAGRVCFCRGAFLIRTPSAAAAR